MTAITAGARPARLPIVLLGAAVLLTCFGVFVGGLRMAGAAAALLFFLAVVIERPFVSWLALTRGLLVLIMFVPIKRYIISGGLPFQPEPYRIYVALLVAAWLLTLLADPRIRLGRTGFEAQIVFLVCVTLASELTNPGRVDGLATTVLKAFTFFLSFLLVVYLLASVVRTFDDVDALVRTLVFGGAVIGVLALFEARTGYNVFNHLDRVFPFLRSTGAEVVSRGGGVRAYGPAQHPIALGAALTMLVPLALYVAVTSRQRRWMLAAGLLTVGSFATLSRTSVVMLIFILAFVLWLRPQVIRRLWPAVIPLLVLTHFLIPGTLGTFKAYFFPSGGLIKNQDSLNVIVDKNNPLWCDASARLVRVGPTLAQVGQKPLLGWGYGTRVTGNAVHPNACVLDDQWLGSLVETGILGVAAWWWLILSFLSRATGIARRDSSRRGWLVAALAAAVGSFSIGMFFFDAFSFIQVTFFFFVCFAFGAILMRLEDNSDSPPGDVVPLVVPESRSLGVVKPTIRPTRARG